MSSSNLLNSCHQREVGITCDNNKIIFIHCRNFYVVLLKWVHFSWAIVFPHYSQLSTITNNDCLHTGNCSIHWLEFFRLWNTKRYWTVSPSWLLLFLVPYLFYCKHLHKGLRNSAKSAFFNSWVKAVGEKHSLVR